MNLILRVNSSSCRFYEGAGRYHGGVGRRSHSMRDGTEKMAASFNLIAFEIENTFRRQRLEEGSRVFYFIFVKGKKLISPQLWGCRKKQWRCRKKPLVLEYIGLCPFFHSMQANGWL